MKSNILYLVLVEVAHLFVFDFLLFSKHEIKKFKLLIGSYQENGLLWFRRHGALRLSL